MADTLRDDEAASRWQAIVQSAVDGIIVIDGHGRIEAFNPAAERLFGYRESEVLGQNVRLLMPPPYRDAHDGYLRDYLETRQPKIIGQGREVTGRRRDGTIFPMHLSVGEMIVDGAPKFTGIIHDLSERVRMERQLREQTALARLGEMAAVVAHEVKNPLAAIRAAVQTLGKRVAPGTPEQDVVPQIVSRIDALSELMHELLMFARPPRPRPVQTDLRVLILGTAEFLKSDPEFAGVRVHVDGDKGVVSADPELLKIVFLNVMANSGQAMSGSGRIAVAIRAHHEGTEVTLHDSGPGVPAEVREMLFTPFFTTKRQGTGLGLATAKRLVEAHGGTIALECPHAGGTRVVVRLPMTPQLTSSSAMPYTR
jgi:two-component system, LuxR family, sensor kinase FixL